jgi:YesN/AraC family two-component response regulator
MPEIIISDVMMPKIDGFELCKKLKTNYMTSHIPVILLTAKASNTDKIEGIETGADEYIIKPFDPGELKLRIKSMIEQRKRIHAHFRKKGLFELEESNITSIDKKFLEKVIKSITDHISDASFSVEFLAESMSMNRAVLYRKIVSLTGQPPVELIRRIRLNRGAEMLEKKSGNISEIALNLGFNNPAYFSECFKKQYGVPPAKYISKIKSN